MIYLNGAPFHSESCSSSKEDDAVAALLKHNVLISSSDSFKAKAERKFSVESETRNSENCKWVYAFQREYATAIPSLVDFIGTDEATTCVGLAIWDPRNGMTSVAHMDSPDIVHKGLDQMLSKFVDISHDDGLDVHIIGAFEDISPRHASDARNSESETNAEGYSIPLCCKIIETLRMRREKFHLKTLCILSHNTRRDSEGIAYPLFTGFVVETSSGAVSPARFDETSRCPDDIVRSIRVTSSYEDHTWDGKLLETYNTETDTFEIVPCHWTRRQELLARFLRSKPDLEVLEICSTSPFAESPDFVEKLRSKWEYLIQHPDWRETFPMNQPRIFRRTKEGGWTRSLKGQAVKQVAPASDMI